MHKITNAHTHAHTVHAHCFHKSYIFEVWAFAAEAPVIPSRFDVMADYNFSKVPLLFWFAVPSMPNVMFIFYFMYYKPTTYLLYNLLSPLTSLFSVGNSGSGPQVSEDSTVAAHTPRAVTARILQLHVRHTRYNKDYLFHSTQWFTSQVMYWLKVMTFVKLFCPPFLLSHTLLVPQDEVAPGVWRSNAQYCDDHR